MESELLVLQEALAGSYSLERELGRGGMGIVYLAREVQLDRLVAIKVLPISLAARPDVRERFLREARTAANLSHPNIVPIHSIGEAGGLPYFVMTYVDGPSLGERLRERGPVSASTMTGILRDVGQALGYAHSRGIVHRDVKPDNILLETMTDRAIVTDFGIASIAGDATSEGVVGTVEFMSPEQLRGEAADARSDLYALGVVAHLALTGKLPERDAHVAELPAAMAKLIDRCLANVPEQRFTSAEEMVATLDLTRAVTRASLPPELRSWANDEVPLLPLFVWTSLTGLYGVIEGISLVSSGVNGSFPPLMGLGMVLLPFLPVWMFQSRKTRRALAAGYRLSDLRFALRTWLDEHREALDEAIAREERTWLRLASYFPLLAATSALGSAALTGLAATSLEFGFVFLTGSLSAFATIASVAALSALGLPAFPRSLQRRLAGRFRSWLWNSRAGEWLARRLASTTEGVPLAAFRPTEMALSVAIDDLFASLPSEYRESLAELPAVARRLTSHVSELRKEGDSLLKHGPGTAAAAINAKRLSEVVTALERLRVGLLRLHGGLADLRPLATALALANALDRDVENLVEAQSEVSGKRTIAAFERHSPSPA